MKFTGKRFLSLALVICFTLFLIPTGASATGIDAGVSFIRLGDKGNATLVKTASGSSMLYGLVDAGTAIEYANYVEPYLTSQLGTAKLSFIALSHLDIDHSGGIIDAINDFADSNTVIYLKDVATNNNSWPSEKNMYDRCLSIKNAAKAKGMPIVKIKPYANFSCNIDEYDDIDNQSDNVFKAKLLKFVPGPGDDYVQSGSLYTSEDFGYFEMTWYNGNNWLNEPYVKACEGNVWKENVNSCPLLLKCTTSSGNVRRTLLASDLGESSDDNYQAHIACRVADLIGPVSIYQMPHHGFYFSVLQATIDILSPKYAIATNSYNDLIYTYYTNKHISNPDSEDLTNATSTIKKVCNSTEIIKVFFTDGMGAAPDYRIINVLADNNYALLNMDNGTIKAGTVSFTFTGSNSIAVSQ